MTFKVLESEIDASVNFVWDISETEALEARYVRRHEEYVACYISTQTGCAQACRMCHLTSTGQNKPRDATWAEITEQVHMVLDHIPDEPKARTVHYNFMARGEPLTSEVMLKSGQVILLELGRLAQEKGLLPRFLVSTIMPKSLPDSLVNLFPAVHPEFYYSLYSMDPKIRKRWLPRAMDPLRALELLAEWQRHTKKIVRIHHPLIEGVNDDGFKEIPPIWMATEAVGLRVDFTLVRYNPPSEKYGKESSNYETYAETLGEFFPQSRIKTIGRVGFDVAASCGMFATPSVK